MKKIVTHTNPDLDAVTAVWLVKRYLSGWGGAEIGFITMDRAREERPWADPQNVLYVDCGFGDFDHHQTAEMTCAAKLVLNYIFRQKGRHFAKEEKIALKRLVDIVNQDDHFRDLVWPEAREDRYLTYFHRLIDELKKIGYRDREVVAVGEVFLNALLHLLENKIRTAEELKAGKKFLTPWGRGIALMSGNRLVEKEGLIQGYSVVVRKNPENGAVRIASRWDRGVDLTEIYHCLQEIDPHADWFLHASRFMLFNQASVAPEMRPTTLTLEEIIKIFADTRRKSPKKKRKSMLY